MATSFTMFIGIMVTTCVVTFFICLCGELNHRHELKEAIKAVVEDVPALVLYLCTMQVISYTAYIAIFER